MTETITWHDVPPGPLAEEIRAKSRPYPVDADEIPGSADWPALLMEPDLIAQLDPETGAVRVRVDQREPELAWAIERLAVHLVIRTEIPAGRSLDVADMAARIRPLCAELIARPPTRDITQADADGQVWMGADDQAWLNSAARREAAEGQAS